MNYCLLPKPRAMLGPCYPAMHTYWILTALNAQLYLIMYIIMFISVVVLRHKKPNVPGNFKIGGGMIGIYFVAMVAVLGGLFTLILDFFPPSQLETGSTRKMKCKINELQFFWENRILFIPYIGIFRPLSTINH